MGFRRHSGFAVVLCPDPAYHDHWRSILDPKSPINGVDDMLTQIIDLTEKAGTTMADIRVLTTEARDLLRSIARPASQMARIIKRVLEDPLNEEGLLPHICRVEAPAAVLGDVSRQLHFLGDHNTVLGGAHTVLWEGHSHCQGIKARLAHLYRGDNQFHLQAGMMTDGAQTFADLHAAVVKRPWTRVQGSYTVFGEDALPLDTVPVFDVQTGSSLN